MTVKELRLIILTAWQFIGEPGFSVLAKRDQDHFVIETTYSADGQDYVINTSFYQGAITNLKTSTIAVKKVLGILREQLAKLRLERARYLTGEDDE